MSLPFLTPEQASQLRKIEPSAPGSYPCQVKLKDGRILDRVLVISAGKQDFKNRLGPAPLRVEDVAEFRESPYRVPAHLARMAVGQESGMGYLIFTVVIDDLRKIPCSTGGEIDFVNLPEGVTSDRIVDLLLHEGREELNRQWNDPAKKRVPFEVRECPFVWPQ